MMQILYCVISRGNTVLTKYASCVGNFSEISDLVISKIPFGDGKMTYKHGNYLYHYIQEEGLVYLCITEEGFGQKDAFHFLDRTQNRFKKRFALRAQTASAYSLNTEFSLVIREEMDRYNKNSHEHEKIIMIQDEVNQVKDIMVRNIDDLVERGEKLDLLVDKTDNLSATAVTFKTTARTVHHKMWWKNVRWTIVVCIAVLIFVYFIVSMSCGGMAWPKCV